MNAISTNGADKNNSEHALVISNSQETTADIVKKLSETGISTVVASNQTQAFKLLSSEHISYILIDLVLTEVPSYKLINLIRDDIAEQIIPIIIIASVDDEELLSSCIAAGCDDILFKPFTLLALNTRISSLKQLSKLKKLYESSLNEQVVAKKILTNAIDERSIPFKEIGYLSRSKSIFSGDLFLTARHPDGSLNILIADFTGHGLSAAMGALPVADAFSVMTKKGFELSYILESINNKLHTLLPTSMFMACSVLNISNDLKHLEVWNGGMPDIYIRKHKTGQLRHQIKSSHIPLGITESILNQYKLKRIEVTPGDQLILFTDGFTEALNKDGDMFGQHRLEQCMEKNIKEKSIFINLVNSFDAFRGDMTPLDDVTLACVPCTSNLMHVNNVDISKNTKISCGRDRRWHWYMEVGGENLCDINPVPHVIDEIHKIYGRSISVDMLSSVISILYENVINAGLDASIKNTVSAANVNYSYRDNSNAYIRIGIKRVQHDSVPALLIQVEDSGRQVTIDDLIKYMNDRGDNAMGSYGEDFPLVYELNKPSKSNKSGNCLEAIIFEHD